MLVVTRKTNERLFIGNDVCIQIIKCQGNQVRIGIEAPKSCLILREEVKDRINGRQDQTKFSKKAQTKRTSNQAIKRR